MFYTVNIKKAKWICLAILAVLLIWLLVNGFISRSVSTDEDRAAFLNKYGYKVVVKPVEVTEITLPVVFDEIYQDYAKIQRENNLDFENYKGKTVTRYTYKVLNYPGDPDTVFANIFEYKDKIIGADIFSPRIDGFVHGLRPKSGYTLPPLP